MGADELLEEHCVFIIISVWLVEEAVRYGKLNTNGKSDE
jgi:hypothetical protein